MKYTKELSAKELAVLKDEDIDCSDIPELPAEFWENATIRIPIAKLPLSIRVDEDIIEWFKAQGKGYQSYMNAVLRSFVDSKKSPQ